MALNHDSAKRHEALRNVAARYRLTDPDLRLWPETDPVTGDPILTADQIFGLPAGGRDDQRRLYLETDAADEPRRQWALLTVHDTNREATDLRGQRFRGEGAVIIDVNAETIVRRGAPSPDSAGLAAAMADEFLRIYGPGSVAGDNVRLILEGPEALSIGVDGAAYRIRVSAGFRWYEAR